MIKEDEEALNEQAPQSQDVKSMNKEQKEKRREAELSSRPDLKEVYYMYSLYEEAKAKFNAQTTVKDFDDYFVEKSKSFTYLHPNNMMHYDDVKAIIDKERKKWDKQHS